MYNPYYVAKYVATYLAKKELLYSKSSINNILFFCYMYYSLEMNCEIFSEEIEWFVGRPRWFDANLFYKKVMNSKTPFETLAFVNKKTNYEISIDDYFVSIPNNSDFEPVVVCNIDFLFKISNNDKKIINGIIEKIILEDFLQGIDVKKSLDIGYQNIPRQNQFKPIIDKVADSTSTKSYLNTRFYYFLKNKEELFTFYKNNEQKLAWLFIDLNLNLKLK